MSRWLTYMLLLGVVALVAAALTLLRGGPSTDPTGGSKSRPRLPAKPIGNTAVGHGGPSPAPSVPTEPGAGPGTFSTRPASDPTRKDGQ